MCRFVKSYQQLLVYSGFYDLRRYIVVYQFIDGIFEFRFNFIINGLLGANKNDCHGVVLMAFGSFMKQCLIIGTVNFSYQSLYVVSLNRLFHISFGYTNKYLDWYRFF